MSVHPQYAQVFAALDRAGIRSCALRDELEGGELRGDLDLLVEDFEHALSVLRSDGYRVLVTERFVPFKSALVKWVDGTFIVLDVHGRLVQDGIVYMDARGVLSRVRHRPGYALPAEDDLLAILLIHIDLAPPMCQAGSLEGNLETRSHRFHPCAVPASIPPGKTESPPRLSQTRPSGTWRRRIRL